jgi:hypothetical protein
MVEFIMMYFGMKLIFFAVGISLVLIGLIGLSMMGKL